MVVKSTTIEAEFLNKVFVDTIRQYPDLGDIFQERNLLILPAEVFSERELRRHVKMLFIRIFPTALLLDDNSNLFDALTKLIGDTDKQLRTRDETNSKMSEVPCLEQIIYEEAIEIVQKYYTRNEPSNFSYRDIESANILLQRALSRRSNGLIEITDVYENKQIQDYTRTLWAGINEKPAISAKEIQVFASSMATLTWVWAGTGIHPDPVSAVQFTHSYNLARIFSKLADLYWQTHIIPDLKERSSLYWNLANTVNNLYLLGATYSDLHSIARFAITRLKELKDLTELLSMLRAEICQAPHAEKAILPDFWQSALDEAYVFEVGLSCATATKFYSEIESLEIILPIWQMDLVLEDIDQHRLYEGKTALFRKET